MTAPTEPLKLTPQAMTLEEALQRLHEFASGSPSENEHTYCPYCGRKLTEDTQA